MSTNRRIGTGLATVVSFAGLAVAAARAQAPLYPGHTIQTPNGHTSGDFVALDLNGDSIVDFASAHGNFYNLTTMLSNGAGGFATSEIPLPALSSALLAGDL